MLKKLTFKYMDNGAVPFKGGNFDLDSECAYILTWQHHFSKSIL